MRPRAETAVASRIISPAPDSARWPRWIMCQPPAFPSCAEYWHIGAMTMRLASSTDPSFRGVKRCGMYLLYQAKYVHRLTSRDGLSGPVRLQLQPCHSRSVVAFWCDAYEIEREVVALSGSKRASMRPARRTCSRPCC